MKDLLLILLPTPMMLPPIVLLASIGPAMECGWVGSSIADGSAAPAAFVDAFPFANAVPIAPVCVFPAAWLPNPGEFTEFALAFMSPWPLPRVDNDDNEEPKPPAVLCAPIPLIPMLRSLKLPMSCPFGPT